MGVGHTKIRKAKVGYKVLTLCLKAGSEETRSVGEGQQLKSPSSHWLGGTERRRAYLADGWCRKNTWVPNCSQNPSLNRAQKAVGNQFIFNSYVHLISYATEKITGFINLINRRYDICKL